MNRAAETEASAPAIPVGGANARYASISSTSRDSSLQPEQGASWSQGAAHFGHEDWSVRMRGAARARRSKKGGSGRESRAQKRNDGCFLRPSNSLTVEQSRPSEFSYTPPRRGLAPLSLAPQPRRRARAAIPNAQCACEETRHRGKEKTKTTKTGLTHLLREERSELK